MSSLFPVSDQPPDQVGTQPAGMDPQPAEKSSSVRTRRWNFLATLRDVWRQHQREKPLGAAPSVSASIVAILKASCEHHPPAGIYLLTFPWSISSRVERVVDFHPAFRTCH
jgi:hypothetical protein